MGKPVMQVMLLSGSGAFLAFYLLGVSPSERQDWQGVSSGYVAWIRSCWAVSGSLALAAAIVLVVKRRVLSWWILAYFWAVVICTAVILELIFTQYFRW